VSYCVSCSRSGLSAPTPCRPWGLRHRPLPEGLLPGLVRLRLALFPGLLMLTLVLDTPAMRTPRRAAASIAIGASHW
jgi:hypothetical protein